MINLEPEDKRLLVYWEAIRDRANREWGELQARENASEVDQFFCHQLRYAYGQIRSTANRNIEEILSGSVQWHRHEVERQQARELRLEQAQPGDVLHHIREGEFILRRRNKYHFRVEPKDGGPERTLPQGDFRDATLIPKHEPAPRLLTAPLFDA